MINIPSFNVRILLLPILFAAGIGCNGASFERAPHQSDEDLIANFSAQRAVFDTLRKMIVQDRGLVSVTDDSTDPAYPLDLGIGRARIAAYRRLLKQAGIAEGISATAERDRIDLIMSSQQIVGRGSIKGYLYSDSIRDDTVDSGASLPSTSDDLSTRPPAFESWTRRIDGNWYLFFERY